MYIINMCNEHCTKGYLPGNLTFEGHTDTHNKGHALCQQLGSFYSFLCSLGLSVHLHSYSSSGDNHHAGGPSPSLDRNCYLVPCFSSFIIWEVLGPSMF